MNGLEQFQAESERALQLLKQILPGRFIALIVVGDNPEDEDIILSQLRTNVEDSRQFIEHIKHMCEELLNGGVEVFNLKNCEGGIQ